MTLVLAAKTKQGVFIGSDAQATSSWHHFNSQHKLIKVANFIVGYTVSYRTGQLIEHNPDQFANIESRADVFTFVQKLKALLEQNGQKKEADAGKSLDHAVGLILATPHAVYSVDSDYSFHAYDRWAVGSGYLYGMGFYDALPTNRPVGERIQRAIASTSEVVQGVGGPVTVWEVGR